VQIIGRAARNAAGKVIMYADKMSDAMTVAIAETERRRAVQLQYNNEHNITPRTIKKAIANILERRIEEERSSAETSIEVLKRSHNILIASERKKLIAAFNAEMLQHAKNLEFEQAAYIRDEIQKIKELGKI
jgi:excinuclease ABC subunit B